MHEQILESGSVILMTDEDVAYIAEFREAIKRRRERIGTSPEAVLRELVATGIYDEDGRLTAQYR